MSNEPEPSDTNHPHDDEPGGDPSRRDGLWRGPRIQLLVLIVGLAASVVGYRIIEGQRLEQSALLFIGLPTLLATLLILGTEARSTLGIVLKGTTLALLMSMIVLGEGAVCVLMAAPIIYMTVVLVWALATWISSIFGRQMRCAAALPLLVVSLEGATESFSFSRAEQVAAQMVVDVPSDEVERRLVRPPRFDTALPTLLQLGFPRPQWIESGGLDPGDRWKIHFAGGEGDPGDLVLEVLERSASSVRFAAVRDDSKIAHWLTWREAIVHWEQVDEDTTRVSMELTYDRELDPAWYFGPLERHAVGLAAGYLLDNLVRSGR